MYWRQQTIPRNNTYIGHSNLYESYMPKKYPQDIECVLKSSDPSKGAIYVSNVEAAENHKTLKKFSIDSVMTCAKGYHKNIPQNHIKMFKYFPCEDKQSCEISIYFDEAVEFIRESLEKTNILVHCIAGVSRSVSMVLAYLMKERGFTYDEAYRHVKSHRKIISPNDGFISQLRRYQNKLKGKKTQSFSERKIQYEHPQSKVSPRRQKAFFENNDEDQINKTASFGNIPHSNTSQSFYTPKKPIYKEQYMKSMRSTNISYDPTSKKKQFLKQMNNDLNSKIQAIHLKYEQAREKLLSKRQQQPQQTRGYSMQKSTPAPSRTQYSASKYNSSRNYQPYEYGRTTTDAFKYANIYQNKYDYGLAMSPQYSGYKRRYIY